MSDSGIMVDQMCRTGSNHVLELKGANQVESNSIDTSVYAFEDICRNSFVAFLASGYDSSVLAGLKSQ